MVRHAERKALQIHNLYSSYQGHKKSPRQPIRSCHSPWRHLVGPVWNTAETHIHDISNTYVPFSQLFAQGKSLKSEGIGMPRDKNKGLWQIA
jgi:cytochrome c551/c552